MFSQTKSKTQQIIKMHPLINTRLRREETINYSGLIKNKKNITTLREKDYYVDIENSKRLDGDAPKELIKLYKFKRGSTIRRKKLHSWTPYIAKTAEKWYPHESIIEYMINRIGQVLGLRMNDIGLYKINGQIRFLSKFFLDLNKEGLIHGAEICGDYLQDHSFAREIAIDKQNSRELFTFSFIEEAIENIFLKDSPQLLEDLVRIVIFDGIVGNNDRHFYNWGVIRSYKKGSKPMISPIYDSARGLFWNFDDDKLVSYYNYLNNDPNFKGIQRYLEKACPRISVEGNANINHFKLITYLRGYNSTYDRIVRETVTPYKENIVLKMLEQEFSSFFIPQRFSLIKLVLKERFKKIRSSETKIDTL